MGKSIKGALNYNEHKVVKGSAELILAAQMSRDISDLGFSQKLNVFEKLNFLNPKAKTNTLHLSLNFAIGEHLETEILQKICIDYMEKIGFGNQPYLVYKHFDTSHPHVHIVTTTIQSNGKSIFLHNIGKRKSEPARKAIEKEYSLIRAESRWQTTTLPLSPIDLKIAYYGQTETKRAISNIVQEVISKYKFSSIEEFNAVLKQYNVIADRGATSSLMYQNKGIVYSIIDRSGYKIGIPVKASAIYASPTLKNLEKKFELNKLKKLPYQKNIQFKISAVLQKSRTNNDFIVGLKKMNIGYTIQSDMTGTIQKMTFVDHSRKVVFTSDDLGLNTNAILQQINHQNEFHINKISTDEKEDFEIQNQNHQSFAILNNLLNTENYDSVSPEFLKKRKKKRKL